MRTGVLDTDGVTVASIYEGRDTLSFALNAAVDVRYEVSDQVDAGLQLRVYTAEEYTEFIAGIGIGYTFGKRSDQPLPALRSLP